MILLSLGPSKGAVSLGHYTQSIKGSISIVFLLLSFWLSPQNYFQKLQISVKLFLNQAQLNLNVNVTWEKICIHLYIDACTYIVKYLKSSDNGIQSQQSLFFMSCFYSGDFKIISFYVTWVQIQLLFLYFLHSFEFYPTVYSKQVLTTIFYSFILSFVQQLQCVSCAVGT